MFKYAIYSVKNRNILENHNEKRVLELNLK